MTIGVAKGGAKGPCPPKYLENIVISCFERRFSKQNSVIRLKSNILAPPNFWSGYATAIDVDSRSVFCSTVKIASKVMKTLFATFLRKQTHISVLEKSLCSGKAYQLSSHLNNFLAYL